MEATRFECLAPVGERLQRDGQGRNHPNRAALVGRLLFERLEPIEDLILDRLGVEVDVGVAKLDGIGGSELRRDRAGRRAVIDIAETAGAELLHYGTEIGGRG